jgi:uncharacterized protein YkwD
MNNRILCAVITVFQLAVFVPSVVALQEDLARQVLVEINLVRTEPLTFARFLCEWRSRFQEKSYQMPGIADPIQTSKGSDAVDEVIQFLSHQKPLPPLIWSAGLADAAAELITEQGRSGATGHGSLRSSGMQGRIEQHGTWKGQIGENIVYGLDDPRSMVIQMIIDEGVPGRGHRKNLFNPVFISAGVSCGSHPRFGRMCAIDFSGRFHESPRYETPSLKNL